MLAVICGCVCLLLLTACGSRPLAPVEEKNRPVPVQPSRSTAATTYRVKSGDTLFGVAFRYGLDYRDVAGWNNIAAPYVIYPDQEIRLIPPKGYKPKPAASQPRVAQTTKPPVKKTPPPTRKPVTARPPAQQTPATGRWLWPTKGRVLRSFKANDSSRNGLDIIGREGQDVIATGAGVVVYSGRGLIGYGELIIIKHNDRLLSAYAHNKRRLVKEGDTIQAGQKIAELGRNDRDESILHFEIRENGHPVDPRKYLNAN